MALTQIMHLLSAQLIQQYQTFAVSDPVHNRVIECLFSLVFGAAENDFLRPLSVISWECSACNLLNLLTLGFWDLICHRTTCLYLCSIWISEKPRSQARKGTSSVGHQMQYQYWRNWKLEKNIKCWMKTALMTKREKLGFASNDRVSHKPTDTGLASLWTAKPRTSHPWDRWHTPWRGWTWS